MDQAEVIIPALEGDGAAQLAVIAAALGVDPRTYKRYEQNKGAPGPDYYVGQTPYIVKAKVRDWVRSLPKTYQPPVLARRQAS